MKLLELTTRILCDVRPGHTADAVFLFGQTQDNQASVFAAACRLLKERLVERVLFVDSAPRSGYPGSAAWKAALSGMGVSAAQMATVDMAVGASLNTLTEAEGIVHHAMRNGYTDLYVTAAPFHQLRAAMTAVTAALKQYPDIRIYSYPGDALPWIDTVTHSQGTTSAQRTELIHGELKRIYKYQQKGDLADVLEVLDYLRRRDRSALLS
jgi:hypothetical protein